MPAYVGVGSTLETVSFFSVFFIFFYFHQLINCRVAVVTKYCYKLAILLGRNKGELFMRARCRMRGFE